MTYVIIRLTTLPSKLETRDKGYSKSMATTYRWVIPDISIGKFTTLRLDLAKLSTSGMAEPQTVTDEEVDGASAKVVTITLKQPVLRQALTMINTFVKKATK